MGNLDAVAEYIAKQREHHLTHTFQNDFVALLERHEIDYDPQYVWG